VTIPLAAPGRTIETLRLEARHRLLFAASFLALGAAFLAVAQAFLLVFAPVGVVSGLILGALLQVLGLSSGAYGAAVFSRAFPLSETGVSARFSLLAALFVVLPVSAGLTALYILFALPEPLLTTPTAFVLMPAIPFLWGPVSSVAAIGFVYAARELSSERMAVAAAIGCGVIVGMTLSAIGGALVQPVDALRSPRLTEDLLLVALGFLAVAFAFHADAWAARSRRVP
jgi:hypothetical protein